MANGASLTNRSAAGDGHLRVELLDRAGNAERLSHQTAHLFRGEVVFQGAAVDEDLARAGGKANPGDGGLASACAEVLRRPVRGNLDVSHNETKWGSDYLPAARDSGCCALCGCW